MDWSNIIGQVTDIFNSFSQKTSSAPAFNGTELELVRKSTDAFCTQGELSINGQFVCYTIELPKVHENQANICIPCGTYSISLYQGTRWPFKTPLLDTASVGRTFVEIHPSNYAIRPSDLKVFLEGCIAPGLSQGQDFDNSSKDAWDLVMSKIDWSRPVRIVITE